MEVDGCDNVTIVSRQEWGARQTKDSHHMNTPVTTLFIHHTAMQPCITLQDCCHEMRTIQNFHMDTRGWDDIGYNFLIGQDGRVYEGRGWNREGAHTKGWNNVAIAFSVMGNFMTHVPNQAALDAVNLMIACAIKENKLTPNYKLYGHRDVGNTACPGDAFYKLIETWPHFAGNLTIVKPTPTP